MSNSEHESSVIERAVNGDRPALQLLLSLHHNRLLAYVERHLPDALRKSLDAQDVVQEVYFVASRAIASFSPSGTDSAFRWLVTIARNEMIDLLRSYTSLKRGAGVVLNGADSDVLSLMDQYAIYQRTPSKSAAAHELVSALEECVGRLPAHYRDVVTLRHLQGLSVAETAERLSRTQEAVHWLCCRALKAMRAEIGSVSRFM